GIDILDPAAERPGDELFWQSGYYVSVRQGSWKLQLDAKRERVWLHDLAADPTEQVNLADERPDVVARLRARIDRHLEGAHPPLYPSYLEAAIGVDKTKAERFEPGDEFVYWPN
ncbi:MAG: sulfatase, partial [Myxococcota bacterium]